MTTRRDTDLILYAVIVPAALQALVGCRPGCCVDLEFALRVRERAHDEFATAVYYKPAPHAMTGLEAALVPLILDETELNMVDPAARICTPVGASGGCDAGRATVYSALSSATITGDEYDQVVYVWFHRGVGPRLVGRGVRIVLGPDGFPMLWEALSSDDDGRVLFVSRSLEVLASKHLSSEVEGRRFAVEQRMRRLPPVVVARVLDDGPVAMGPWVQVARPPGRSISAVLCRCMPSQVHEIVQTIEYDLQPFEALGATANAAWVQRVSSSQDLSDLLRWPDLRLLAGGGAGE